MKYLGNSQIEVVDSSQSVLSSRGTRGRVRSWVESVLIKYELRKRIRLGN